MVAAFIQSEYEELPDEDNYLCVSVNFMGYVPNVSGLDHILGCRVVCLPNKCLGLLLGALLKAKFILLLRKLIGKRHV
jgi:hypothetical protein